MEIYGTPISHANAELLPLKILLEDISETGRSAYRALGTPDFRGVKEGRTARLHQRTSENEHFEVEEGFLYEAGIAD
ncbi:hypothetical protein CDAR_510341 [Caerostris darwini]|uniref:Uncharacterized protein n=1 Tax=Caerostris darwini TaxID=1538125 RepID=A0AAV4UY18_9ARAC|nr:hypothetical protein CDAR_510341 [Caerostris darwini]